MGNALTDFDDPNLPSLLAMPLLGFEYDADVYAATRRRILSSNNKYYFEGSNFTGLGSPHTPDRYIWPLAHMVDALTTDTTAQQGALGVKPGCAGGRYACSCQLLY